MQLHKYSDLGQAPYSLVGYFADFPVQDTNGAWHGGQHSCDHCGRPIGHVFVCKSSDGKTFNLGSVHVEELGDEGLTQAVKTKMTEIQKEARRVKYKEQQEANDRIEREAALEQLGKMKAEAERVKPFMQSKPHPNAYFASKGKTLYDYFLYFIPGYGTEEFNNYHPSVQLRELCKLKPLITLREAGARV